MELKSTLLAAILLSMSSTTLDAQEFKAKDTAIGTQICMALAKNSKPELRDTLSYHRAKKHIIKKKLACNELSVETFIERYNLGESAQYFNIKSNNNYVNKKVQGPIVIQGTI